MVEGVKKEDKVVATWMPKMKKKHKLFILYHQNLKMEETEEMEEKEVWGDR
jgi:hypothetical protein